MAHLKKLLLGNGGNLESFSGKKPQHSGFLLKKKQDKLDQHQILVFHDDVDHFSIWLHTALFVRKHSLSTPSLCSDLLIFRPCALLNV